MITLPLQFSFCSGKLETFAERARIVHIDVDPAEINKNKEAHIPMCTCTQPALAAINAELDTRPLPDGAHFSAQCSLTACRESCFKGRTSTFLIHV